MKSRWEPLWSRGTQGGSWEVVAVFNQACVMLTSSLLAAGSYQARPACL